MRRGSNYNKFGVITSKAVSTSVFATSSPGVYYGFKTDWRSITHNAALPTITLRLITTCLGEALRIYGTQRQQTVSNKIRDNCPANSEQDLKIPL